MTTELTVWAKLDSQRALREIEVAYGSPLFSQWSLLDPDLAAAQMSGAFSAVFTPFDLLSVEAFALRVDAAIDANDEDDNTAPRDIVIAWEANWTDGEVTASNAISSGLIGTASATDDEDDVLTWSVNSDETLGLLFINATNGNLARTNTLVAGIYNFRLRATDPDGLFAEQEFTITVTS